MTTIHISPPIPASFSRIYTAEEWEQKRGLITELYGRGISQKELLNVLACQHDFHPTISMLKKRIHKWNIDRKNKESDIVAALQVSLQREAQGKKTEFVIRSRLVSGREIKRYLRRKGIRDARDFVVNSAQLPSIPSIAAYTPPRSPAIPEPSGSGLTNHLSGADLTRDEGNFEMHHDETGQLPSSIPQLVVRPGTNHIYHAIAGPAELELLQQALVSNGAYYDSIFETSKALMIRSSNQTLSLQPPEAKDLTDFTNGMWRGRDLLIEGQLSKAFKCFDQAFASIHPILMNQSMKFLPELYEMILNFQLEEQQDVLRPLLKFVIKMAEAKQASQPTNHLIAKIASCLLNISAADRSCVVELLLRNIFYRFQSDLAYNHRESLSILKVLSRSLFRRKQMSEAIDYLTKLLQDDQTICRMDTYEKCGILVELAQCCRFQNRLDDALSWIGEAWQRAETLDNLYSQTDIRVRCLRTFSRVECKRRNWQSAHGFARQAVEISSSFLGRENSLTGLVEAELNELESEINDVGITMSPS